MKTRPIPKTLICSVSSPPWTLLWGYTAQSTAPCKASVDEVASALTVSFSTIGKLVKHTEAPEFKGTELSQYIVEHELCQLHQQFVAELITMVCQQQKQVREFIRELRRLSANEGVSHLGISLH